MKDSIQRVALCKKHSGGSQIRTVIAVLLCLSSAGISALAEYRLEMAPEHLEMLYDDPSSPVEYPGVISCSGWSSPCMVRFRGKSTLVFPKKSWAMSFPDPSVSGRERINLNSEYMDPGMMRNCLAMRVSSMMGLPASRTEHVRFYVNDEYMGVYLDVERVDGDMFQRYGFDSVALFKARNESTRMMPFFSGRDLSEGYEARGYSEMLYHHLAELLAMVDSGAWPLPVDGPNFMGYYAVSLALVSRDAGSNNHYLMLDSDGMWRVFPWDCGSTFGGLSDGEFHPELAVYDRLEYFRMHMLYDRLCEHDENLELMEYDIGRVQQLLMDSVPLLIDSLFQEVGPDLHDDPLSPFTPEEIDQAREDLLWFCAERAAFIQDNVLLHQHGQLLSLDVESPWLEGGETSSVNLVLQGDYTFARMRWYQGDQAYYLFLTQQDPGRNEEWSGVFSMPQGVAICPFDLFFRTPSQERFSFTWPVYSLNMFPVFQQAVPCFVNPHPGSFPPDPSGGDLTPGPLTVYGPELWAVPLVNLSDHPVDLSGCGFRLGEGPGRLFLGPCPALLPGDTLFLANSLASFQAMFPGRQAAGDFGLYTPGWGSLTMFDPVWRDMWTKPLSTSQQEPWIPAGLKVTEICHSQPPGSSCPDWIELCNLSGGPVCPLGWQLGDIDGNRTLIDHADTLQPGEFLVLAREPWQFYWNYPVECAVAGLSFRANGECDLISLYDIGGNTVQMVELADETGQVTGLVHPGRDIWESCPFPGTPGEPNRLWSAGGIPLSLKLLSSNPCSSRFLHFSVTSLSYPVEAGVYDLCGREVVPPAILAEVGPQATVELPGSLPPGVYFLTARTPGEFAAVKFTKL